MNISRSITVLFMVLLSACASAPKKYNPYDKPKSELAVVTCVQHGFMSSEFDAGIASVHYKDEMVIKSTVCGQSKDKGVYLDPGEYDLMVHCHQGREANGYIPIKADLKPGFTYVLQCKDTPKKGPLGIMLHDVVTADLFLLGTKPLWDEKTVPVEVSSSTIIIM